MLLCVTVMYAVNAVMHPLSSTISSDLLRFVLCVLQYVWVRYNSGYDTWDISAMMVAGMRTNHPSYEGSYNECYDVCCYVCYVACYDVSYNITDT